ncbi:hypothetical protein DVH24_009143 [Malus domestica]|uniref:Uncharacterized protein n=1 Tax=Malus domestica TaxID=3750 RepID=A0A498JL30_MALDO|nr:hypothetical protein DVH24_009143 [Malus domestica]
MTFVTFGVGQHVPIRIFREYRGRDVSVEHPVTYQASDYIHGRVEGVIKQQFGEVILDELFDLYRKKLEEQPFIFDMLLCDKETEDQDKMNRGRPRKA